MPMLTPVSLEKFQTVRVWDSVTEQTFWNEIYPLGAPAILRGHCKDWDAVSMADAPNVEFVDYLKKFNAEGMVNILMGRGDMEGRYFYNSDLSGFNFDPRTAPLSAFLEKLLEVEVSKDALNLYSAATPVETLFPGFSHNNLSTLPPEGTPPLIWIGNRARIAPHFDSSDNIACCLRGPRTFLLFPPEHISNLYVGPIDHTMAGQPASLVDPKNVDLETFPKYAEAEKNALIAELEPGDAIYIPSLWWHYVQSYDPLSVLINYWWLKGNPGPGIASLAHAILNLRELPLHHRQAWKSFFDHYVFSDEAPQSVDHIPAHAKGVLAPPSPERDRKIKTFLQHTLR